MRGNPRVRGAVVTSHKLRMHRAIADLVDDADPLAAITHELNALDTRDGVRVHARDPQALDVLLDAMAPRFEPGGSVVCLGSGGAAIALMLAMGLDVRATIESGRAVARDPRSGRGALTILGIEPAALDEVRHVRRRAGLAGVEVALAPTPGRAAARTRAAAPGSVVVNATGLGKTAPGSPLPDGTALPPGALAWDFNYRGPLSFLAQAREAGAATADGWDYFLAGWTAALAAITGIEPTPDLFARVRAVSTDLRVR
jgi:shikimate 5-dehydrogenase